MNLVLLTYLQLIEIPGSVGYISNSMFIQPTITWVPSGFFGYIWLDTKIVLQKAVLLKMKDSVITVLKEKRALARVKRNMKGDEKSSVVTGEVSEIQEIRLL